MLKEGLYKKPLTIGTKTNEIKKYRHNTVAFFFFFWECRNQMNCCKVTDWTLPFKIIFITFLKGKFWLFFLPIINYLKLPGIVKYWNRFCNNYIRSTASLLHLFLHLQISIIIKNIWERLTNFYTNMSLWRKKLGL